MGPVDMLHLPLGISSQTQPDGRSVYSVLPSGWASGASPFSARALSMRPEHRSPPSELQVRGDHHRLPLVGVGEDPDEDPRAVPRRAAGRAMRPHEVVDGQRPGCYPAAHGLPHARRAGLPVAADDRDRDLVDVDGDADAQLLAGLVALARLPVALGEVGVVDVGLVHPDGVAQHDPVLVAGRCGEHAVPPLDINRINAVHSLLGAFIEPFRGVSTKHLGAYLAWFRWRRTFMAADPGAAERTVARQLAHGVCRSRPTSTTGPRPPHRGGRMVAPRFTRRGEAMPSNIQATTIRIDPEFKKEATAILDELGLSMSTAVNAFLRALVREGGMPFEMRVKAPEPDGEPER